MSEASTGGRQAGTGRDAGGTPCAVQGRLRAVLPAVLLALLPLTFIIPNFMRVGPFRVNWYELLLPLIFLLGWNRRGSRLALTLIGLAGATALAVFYGSTLFGVEPSTGSFALVRYVIVYIAALQLGLRLRLSDLDRPNSMALLAFLLLFGIVAASALAPGIRTAVAAIYGFVEHDHPRFQLIDPNPLVLGSVAIILYFLASRGRTSGVRIALLVPTFITVLLAQQRTSTILLLLFVFLSEYVLRRRNVVPPLVASVALSGLLLAAVVTYGGDSGYSDRVATFSLERQSRSAIGRLLGYRLQFQQVRDFPALGVGRFPDEVGLPLAGWYPAPRVEPHSQYVGIAYEVGLVGVVIFGVLVVQVFRIGAGLYRQRRRSYAARSVLAFGILNLVAMAPWESLYLPHWSVVFFLLCGLGLGDKRNRKRRVAARARGEPVLVSA